MIGKLHQAGLKSGRNTLLHPPSVTAVQRMAALAMMAGLLTSPAAPPGRPPDQPPARPRYRFYLWHLFMDWLGYRRARRTKPAEEPGG